MQERVQLEILPQPDDMTCGPTCLHAVYRYFDDEVPLGNVIREIPQLEDGGTLAVSLGRHALGRGYRATIYTYNLKVFDPTWFQPRGPNLVERLRDQAATKDSSKLRAACGAYVDFLQAGGQILMRDLDGSLLRRYLKRSVPLLTGLSSTYLYRAAREYGPNSDPDDVRGVAMGHFVVLCGYDAQQRKVEVADPYRPNPLGAKHYYEVNLERLICAILLGVLTYDANLLVIEPRGRRPPGGGAQQGGADGASS